MRTAAGKRGIQILWLICLVFLFPEISTGAAPGNFLALFPVEKDGVSGFMALQTERQVNKFAKNRVRRPEIDAQGEERHYSELRELETTFNFDGIKTGAAFGRLPLIYAVAGYGRAEVDFSYTDELTENKDEYFRQARFENDGFPVFGAGIAAMAYDTQVLEDSRFAVGLDLQYRWLNFTAENGALSYESTLHEIQLAIAASLETLTWQPGGWVTLEFAPYGGVKIMYFEGDEAFSDPANTDSDGNPDPIQHSGDVEPGNHITWFLGTTLDLTKSLFMGIETHFGDDDGYGAQLGCRF